jgi:hypothetical protein
MNSFCVLYANEYVISSKNYFVEYVVVSSELAFYDALEVNDSAVMVLGDETLRQIARELVEAVRKNMTIDWTVKESARQNCALSFVVCFANMAILPISKRRLHKRSWSKRSYSAKIGRANQ